jgi:serine/threonine-protein kinase
LAQSTTPGPEGATAAPPGQSDASGTSSASSSPPPSGPPSGITAAVESDATDEAIASALPTQRPARGAPFAGLLAEAGVAKGDGETVLDLNARIEARNRSDLRKHQETLKIEGRGKTELEEPKTVSHVIPPSVKSSLPPPPVASTAPGVGASASAASPPAGSDASSSSTSTSTAAAPSEGRTIGGYRVLGELGSGGMAVVYKAVQPTLDRLVAIKELRTEFVHDPQIAKRFEREATSLAALQHGNIVHIYDFVHDFDSAYIVMEYVEGIDLFDLLVAVGRLPPDVAAIVALQLAEALEYAHYRGIIHRDIKPSNILISKVGEVKIMDFGIARDPGRADLTQVGMALGTPAYMAPEQIRGDKIDFRADVFAFGIVLYEMLTGSKPWGEDEGVTVSRKVLNDDYVPVTARNPDVPPALAQIIEICLRKMPAQRYRSTHDLRRAVEEYVAREVPVDPRQRLVVCLKNRKVIPENEARSVVPEPILNDATFRRRDLGLAGPSPRELLRPVAITNAGALALIVLATLLGLFLGYGERLPSQRPKLIPADRVLHAPEP